MNDGRVNDCVVVFFKITHTRDELTVALSPQSVLFKITHTRDEYRRKNMQNMLCL